MFTHEHIRYIPNGNFRTKWFMLSKTGNNNRKIGVEWVTKFEENVQATTKVLLT